jgi:hypothetical protein
MATQEWTIFALVGDALPDIESRLSAWSAARGGDDPSAWSSRDWPARVARSASRFVESLSRNRFLPPVVYWSRHVDLWSSFGGLFRFLPKQPPVIAYGGEELWSYRLPDRGKLLRRVRAVRKSSQFQENLWLANAIESAATAYKGLCSESVVLVHRHVLTASPTDAELLGNAARRSRGMGREIVERKRR